MARVNALVIRAANHSRPASLLLRPLLLLPLFTFVEYSVTCFGNRPSRLKIPSLPDGVVCLRTREQRAFIRVQRTRGENAER